MTLIRPVQLPCRGLFAVFVLCFSMPASTLGNECREPVTGQIRLEPHHPWAPPFGLERPGKGFTAVVEIHSDVRPLREYWLSSQAEGKEVERKIVALAGIFSKPPFIGKVTFAQPFDELVLFGKCRFEGAPAEVSRQKVSLPELEAEAVARPDKLINPVNLGAILVPYDWLLLAGGQKGSVEVAAVSFRRDQRKAQISAWFESATQAKSAKEVDLIPGKKAQFTLPLPATTSTAEKDVLHVAIAAEDGKELWHKKIQTMRVNQPPRLPEFGATALKLRYDAPISVRNPETGTFSSMEYNGAWDSSLNDVVVSLPNGSRYVFWRGSSYIPFWAGQHNTGMSYEWAETLPPADGFVDCVEPLMDKELRYSRVEIVESTPARVHVRWRYQSTDFMYKVWGDMPVEDYIFYPDGFGTRTLTLKSALASTYEVQEFIIIAPQSAFPFEVLDPKIVDILFIDGQKREIQFPARGEKSTPGGIKRPGVGDPRDVPAIYRVRLHKDDAAAAISFSPYNTLLPEHLWSLLRSGPDGDSLLLGQPLAAGPGKHDRHGDRRSNLPESVAQQHHDLGDEQPHSGVVCDAPDSRHLGPAQNHGLPALALADRVNRCFRSASSGMGAEFPHTSFSGTAGSQTGSGLLCCGTAGGAADRGEFDTRHHDEALCALHQSSV